MTVCIEVLHGVSRMLGFDPHDVRQIELKLSEVTVETYVRGQDGLRILNDTKDDAVFLTHKIPVSWHVRTVTDDLPDQLPGFEPAVQGPESPPEACGDHERVRQ